LRLARHALAPELPLATPRSVWHAASPVLVAALVVLALLLFGTWLDTDPDDWTRALGSMLVAALTAGLTWCGGWALLSKIFTRHRAEPLVQPAEPRPARRRAVHESPVPARPAPGAPARHGAVRARPGAPAGHARRQGQEARLGRRRWVGRR